MKIFDEYLHNAWGRRMVRDYPKMPSMMRWFFVVNHYFNKCCVWISFLALAATLASMVMVVNGTWLTGGSALISESSWLIPMVLLFGFAAIARWILPVISNFTFNHWYHTSRSSF